MGYHYKINECEHVLLTDGQRILPVAVLTRTISGEQKMVKVLSGLAKVEVIPESGSLILKVNGQLQAINKGKLFVVKDKQTSETIAEVKYYQDGVYQIYAPLQMMHVITDGKRVEIVAPQLLRNRALGLCGNMNGEEVADLTTPKRCIMQPKLAAMSYMLNKNGNEPIFAQIQKKTLGFRQHMNKFGGVKGGKLKAWNNCDTRKGRQYNPDCGTGEICVERDGIVGYCRPQGRQVQNNEETLVGGSGRMGEYNVMDAGFEYGAHGMKGGYGAGSEGGTGGLEVGPRSGFGSPDDFNSGRHLGGSCPEGLKRCEADCETYFAHGPDYADRFYHCQSYCEENCK